MKSANMRRQWTETMETDACRRYQWSHEVTVRRRTCSLQRRSADYYHVVNCTHYVCADCPWAVVVLTELPGARGSCPTLLILYSERAAPRSNRPSSTSRGSRQYCPPNGGLLSHRRVTRHCQGCPCRRRLGHLREEPIVIGLIHQSLSC